jgi:hypothetical protein
MCAITENDLMKYIDGFKFFLNESNITDRSVIGEVRCGFLWIYAPTPYSAVFLLHAPAPALIKIGFGAVWCGAV